MNKILALSDKTISQIAAGEIIENPASVCKELVENSLDAGAKKIILQLGDELTDFIRITDDGEGISKEDIPLAFRRHSTSKLKDINDLDNIFSLGFRGEALASIANISQIELVTKTADAKIGNKAYISNGSVEKILPIGAPNGTSILIKNIFYNTPVRKKYLKSTKVELDNIIKEIESIALSRNDVSIHVSHKTRTLLQSHASKDKINHIYSILGKEIASNLIPIKFTSESYKIEGYISNNTIHRSNPQREYLFINGRNIRSKEISKKIRSLYHTLIPLQRYPIFILYLKIDPILIDVNVHPQKQYVRLSNENYVLDILDRLIREKLYSNRRVLSISSEDLNTSKEKVDSFETKTIFEMVNKCEVGRENKLEKYNNLDNTNINDIRFKKEEVEENKKFTSTEVSETETDYKSILDYDEKVLKDLDVDINYLDYIGVIFKTYLLYENKITSEIFLMDQHAAHERILFEKFYSELISGKIDKQILLNPVIINLSPSESLKAINHSREFLELGFTLEKFGPNKLILREVPIHSLLSDYESFIKDSLTELDDDNGIVEQNIYKVMRMACRAAIKAGDKIGTLEAEHLLVDLFDTHNPFSCPHGRPTIIKVNKKVIEKLFLREG